MTLPEGFSPLPFSSARGVPQTVSFEQYQVTLAASTSDLPALLQTPRTDQIIDLGARDTSRIQSVPVDERALLTSPPPTTLDAIRPVLIVRENDLFLGTRPAQIGTPLRFSTSADVPLAVEIVVDTLKLAAASLTQPGDVGTSILIGIRTMTSGVDRVEQSAPPHPDEEDLYARLV